MTSIITYIIITLTAFILQYFLFEKNRLKFVEFSLMRRMLRMELTNDMANTDVSISRWKSDAISNPNIPSIVQPSLLSGQLMDVSKEDGEEFIIFVEKWLMFYTREKCSTYQFYANKAFYTRKIHPQIQYDISLWISKLLGLKLDHIQLDLAVKNENIVLNVSELKIDNSNIDFNAYLEQESWKKLPGLAVIKENKTITITFSE